MPRCSCGSTGRRSPSSRQTLALVLALTLTLTLSLSLTLTLTLTLTQALAHWFGSVSRPTALQRAFRGHSLLPLGAPTELDLELLSRSQLVEQPAALHSAFGAALGDAAAAVAGGLAPLPQVSADGASLGAWASLVSDWLNRESE